MLVASYQILLGQAPMSYHSPYHKDYIVEQQSTPAAPPVPVSKQSPGLKRCHPSPDPVDSMPLCRTTSKTTSGEPPLQTVRGPTLEQGTQAEPLGSIQSGL